MKKKKRKLNKKGKLLTIFLSTLLIMSIFQILGTKQEIGQAIERGEIDGKRNNATSI